MLMLITGLSFDKLNYENVHNSSKLLGLSNQTQIQKKYSIIYRFSKIIFVSCLQCENDNV